MKKIFAVAFLVPYFLLTGCVYTQHASVKVNGSSISEKQVALVETGKTTKQWVLANFGIPDRTMIDKNGLEVFEYVSEQTQKSDKSFIFLFNVESEKKVDHQVTRVVMRNDVVESVGSIN